MFRPLRAIKILMLLMLTLMLGCAYRPKFEYAKGNPVAIPAGEGLVGLRVKFANNIQFIEFKGMSSGSKTFQVDNPQDGLDLRIFHLPPGKYCQYRFGGHNWYLYDESPSLCFEVIPDIMSYGGDYHERFQAVLQQMNYKDFLTQLQSEHEDLFNQFFVSK